MSTIHGISRVILLLSEAVGHASTAIYWIARREYDHASKLYFVRLEQEIAEAKGSST